MRRPSKFIVATEGGIKKSEGYYPYMRVLNKTNWGSNTVVPRHTRDVNVLWGDGHVSSVSGYGGSEEQISRSLTDQYGQLQGAPYAGNCWTYDGNVRPGAWFRP